ncbi:MAG: helix-turn-helix domain-containing protein, partial [Deltaproteobacteria bacterium]|nr:helix-turn-helix domain-containing protein [Deltaproteobacteria bacterium]
WPGNIRELRNLLERVLVESSGEIVGLRSFREWAHERHALSLRKPIETPATILAGPPARPLLSAASGTSFPVGSAVVPNAERLRRAYEEAGGNISQAARLLGMHRATFYRHLKRLELTREKLGHGEKSNGDG